MDDLCFYENSLLSPSASVHNFILAKTWFIAGGGICKNSGITWVSWDRGRCPGGHVSGSVSSFSLSTPETDLSQCLECPLHCISLSTWHSPTSHYVQSLKWLFSSFLSSRTLLSPNKIDFRALSSDNLNDLNVKASQQVPHGRDQDHVLGLFSS